MIMKLPKSYIKTCNNAKGGPYSDRVLVIKQGAHFLSVDVLTFPGCLSRDFYDGYAGSFLLPTINFICLHQLLGQSVSRIKLGKKLPISQSDSFDSKTWKT